MKPKILFIDEDERNAAIFQLIFTEYSICYAHNREFALYKMKKKKDVLKLVICDYATVKNGNHNDGRKFLLDLKECGGSVPKLLIIEDDLMKQDPIISKCIDGYVAGPIINKLYLENEIFKAISLN
jgi:hypothetical protein